MSSVIEIRTYKLVDGSSERFDRIFNDEALPMLQRAGISVVTAGPSLTSDSHYILIRHFASLQARDQQLADFYASREWLEHMDAKVMALIESYHTVALPADTFIDAVRALPHRSLSD
jgi:hypothetical protein